MAGDGGRALDVSEQRSETYLTGARIIEMLRRAEYIEIDGPGMAAHQIETVLDVDEDEAAEVCRLLVTEGYAVEHQTKGGTPFWRYRDADDQPPDPTSVLAALLAEQPDATIAALETLLTSDEAVDHTLDEMTRVFVAHGPNFARLNPTDMRLVALRLSRAACRSLRPKAPKEDRDA